jgi:diaminopimelate decarboxylase
VAKVAKAKGVKVNVLARVAPGIECHTHDYIKTGQNDSKFGFPLNRVDEMLEAVLQHPEQLDFKGIHGHVGSQIFELRAYQDLVSIFFQEMDRIRQKYGITLPDLDLGGGWGIAYTQADSPLPIPTLIQTVVEAVKASAQAFNYPLPRLLFEPGRSLMARAGVTIYTVGARKEVEGALPYIAVDGGMGDNIRPALYQAEYSACVVSQLGKAVATEAVRVVGKYCESGDVVLRRFEGPAMKNGDLLLIFGTGAYNYTMASTYNRIGRPAMVLVENGQHGVLIERESVRDLLALDRIPSWLA